MFVMGASYWGFSGISSQVNIEINLGLLVIQSVLDNQYGPNYARFKAFSSDELTQFIWYTASGSYFTLQQYSHTSNG